MVSIICVYNNFEILNKFLIPSLRRQKNKDYELILYNNSTNNLTAASLALNCCANKAKGEILIFVHQDVYFIDDESISKIVDFCSKYEFGLAGVAGVDDNGNVLSSVLQGQNRQIAGKLNTSIREIEVLDECLLIVKRKNFFGFEYLGNTWHLYGVEYSLFCKRNRLVNFLYPIMIWHYSPGLSLNDSYFKTVKNFFALHTEITKFDTTMGGFKNNYIFNLRILYLKLKFRFMKKFNIGIRKDDK